MTAPFFFSLPDKQDAASWIAQQTRAFGGNLSARQRYQFDLARSGYRGLYYWDDATGGSLPAKQVATLLRNAALRGPEAVQTALVGVARVTQGGQRILGDVAAPALTVMPPPKDAPGFTLPKPASGPAMAQRVNDVAHRYGGLLMLAGLAVALFSMRRRR